MIAFPTESWKSHFPPHHLDHSLLFLQDFVNRKKIYQAESTIKHVAQISMEEDPNDHQGQARYGKRYPGGGLLGEDDYQDYDASVESDDAEDHATMVESPSEHEMLASSLLEATQQMADLISSMGSSMEQV